MGCIFSSNDDDDLDISAVRHLPVISVAGVPGAGNQTVGQAISKLTDYSIICPGDLVREEATKDSPMGRLINEKMAKSQKVPEQITVDLMKEAMLSKQNAKGFILVGFPKNLRMSNLFNRQVKKPEKVVALEVDNEVAATRLQTKLSELGRPAHEIDAAADIVKEAAAKVRDVRRRLWNRVITVDTHDQQQEVLTETLRKLLMEENEEEESQKDESELDADEEIVTPEGEPVPTNLMKQDTTLIHVSDS